MLMVMVRRSATCRPLFPPFRRGLHRVVLPKWESLPSLRHEDTPEIGMALKANSEHVKHFTFVPVGGTPDRRDAGHRLLFLDLHLKPDSPLVLKGKEMVDHLETWMVSEPIDRGEIRKEIVEKTRILFQVATDTNKVAGPDEERRFVAKTPG